MKAKVPTGHQNRSVALSSVSFHTLSHTHIPWPSWCHRLLCVPLASYHRGTHTPALRQQTLPNRLHILCATCPDKEVLARKPAVPKVWSCPRGYNSQNDTTPSFAFFAPHLRQVRRGFPEAPCRAMTSSL